MGDHQRHQSSVLDFNNDTALRQALSVVAIAPEGSSSPELKCTITDTTYLPRLYDWQMELEKDSSVPQSLDDEMERLKVLRSYRILDSDKEDRFERLTGLASRMFGVPIALVSLVDLGRQWFMSNRGLGEVRQTPRKVAFCGHAICSKHDIFVVNDATKDKRFMHNSLVTSDPNIRFYAGAPLITPEGYKIGTFCIIDTKPWPLGLNLAEKMNLLELAALAMETLVKRRDDLNQSNEDRSARIACIANDLLTPLSGVMLNLSMVLDDKKLQGVMDEHQRELIQASLVSSELMSRICHKAMDSFREEQTHIIHPNLLKNGTQLANRVQQEVGNKAQKNSFHFSKSLETNISLVSDPNPNFSRKKFSSVNISHFMNNLITVLEMHPKSVPIFIDVHENVPPEILSDDIKIFRSLVNYLTNACKFTEIGSINLRIFVTGQNNKLKASDSKYNESDMVCFECEDTGPGVDISHYPDLFKLSMQHKLANSLSIDAEDCEDGIRGLGLYSVATNITSLHGEYGYRPRDKATSRVDGNIGLTASERISSHLAAAETGPVAKATATTSSTHSDEDSTNNKNGGKVTGSIFWFKIPLILPGDSLRHIAGMQSVSISPKDPNHVHAHAANDMKVCLSNQIKPNNPQKGSKGTNDKPPNYVDVPSNKFVSSLSKNHSFTSLKSSSGLLFTSVIKNVSKHENKKRKMNNNCVWSSLSRNKDNNMSCLTQEILNNTNNSNVKKPLKSPTTTSNNKQSGGVLNGRLAEVLKNMPPPPTLNTLNNNHDPAPPALDCSDRLTEVIKNMPLPSCSGNLTTLNGSLSTKINQLPTIQLPQSNDNNKDQQKCTSITSSSNNSSNMDVDTSAMPPPSAHPPSRRKRALVIDDSITIRKSIGRALTNIGFEVCTACDGMEGLKKLKSTVYDITFCDFLMPIMDGFDCIKQYRDWEKSHRPIFSLYIIGISAHASKNDMEHSKSVGMNRFYSKPIKLNLLKELAKSEDIIKASTRLDELYSLTSRTENGVFTDERENMQVDVDMSVVKKVSSSSSSSNNNNMRTMEGGNTIITNSQASLSQQGCGCQDFSHKFFDADCDLSTSSSRPENSSGLVCLLALKSKSVRNALIPTIEAKGFRVCSVDNGEDALRLLKIRNWDFVLLGEQMPTLTSSSCINRFRHWEATNRVARQNYVYLLSSTTTNYSDEMGKTPLIEAAPHGFDGIIGKPVSMRNLNRVLEGAVSSKGTVRKIVFR